MTDNIGQLIKRVADLQGLTHEKVAEKINLTKSAVGSIYRRATIDIELLIRISFALNHDFFATLYDHPQLKGFKEAKEKESRELLEGMQSKINSQEHTISIMDEHIKLQKKYIEELEEKMKNL